MSSGQGVIIAKRSISLSKTYIVIGIFLALLGVLVSGVFDIVGNSIPSVTQINGTGTSSPINATSLQLISVPLQVFAAILISTPVLLLYVYDRNNGVLEYFLSIGMDQGDIYREYLKAALIISSSLVGFEVVLNVVVGLVEGAGQTLTLEVSGLVVAIALPVVSFVALIMMAFSSLQKQRVGSNQPLGIAIGVFMVMPAYLIPLALPSLALVVDPLLAVLILALALLMYFLSSRLISREKLLP
jgi:hypothetical protein